MSRQLQQLQTADSGVVTSAGGDSVFSLAEALVFWNEMLSGPLLDALQNDNHSQLRATCCDCLSNMGAAVFENIEVSVLRALSIGQFWLEIMSCTVTTIYLSFEIA